MNTAAVPTRALLGYDELAYLLGLVSAGPIVGLDNTRIDEADLGAGFSQLVANRRLTMTGGTHTVNGRLALLVAVMATPERSLMVTRKNEEAEQVVTYCATGGTIVEHYRTDGDRHLITELSSEAEMFLRICEATSDVVPAEPTEGVRLSTALFGQAITMPTATGRQDALSALFRAGGAAEDVLSHWATVVTPSKWSVSIEGAGYAGRLPVSRRDIYCFGSPGVLVVGAGGPEDQVAVCGYTTETSAALTELVWRSLADHRRVTPEG